MYNKYLPKENKLVLIDGGNNMIMFIFDSEFLKFTDFLWFLMVI
jgi:hypothetical protein